MQNQFDECLHKLLLKLTVREELFDESNKHFTSNEVNEVYKIQLVLENIRNEIRPTAWKESQYLEWVLFIYQLTELIDIKTGLYNNNEPTAQKIHDSILKFKGELIETLKHSTLNIVIKVEFEPIKQAIIDNLNIVTIQGILADYNILRLFESCFINSKNGLKNEFRSVRLELLSLLENAKNYSGEDELLRYINSKAVIGNGKRQPIQIHLSSSMISALIESLINFRVIMDKLFQERLTVELIEEMINLINLLETFSFEDETLKRLKNAFKENAPISNRLKMLFIHEILLIFKYPLAMTELDEEVHLKKEGSTLSTLNQAKIRIVTRIIGPLK